MIQELPKPKINIAHLEDELEYANLVKEEIQEEIQDRFKEYDVDYQIFTSKEELRQYSKEQYGLNEYILDINHGARREQEGIDAIDVLDDKEEDNAMPIMLTAYVDNKHRNSIVAKGVREENIIHKEDGRNDIDQVIERISIQLASKIKAYEHKIHQYKERFITLPKINIQFKKLRFEEKLFLCKSLLNNNLPDSYHLLLDGHHWQIKVNEDVNNLELKNPDNFVFAQIINPINNELEGFIAKKTKKKSAKCFIPTFKAIYQVFEYFKSKGEKDFNSFLIEIFIAQRLSDIFLTAFENSDLQKDLIKLAKSLTPKIGRQEFIIDVWEYLTEFTTENIAETNKKLQWVYDQGFPKIKDVYYCQVESHINKEYAKIVMHSVENLEEILPIEMEMDNLGSAGVKNEFACFKLTVYHTDDDAYQRPGQKTFIEPITLETYLEKTDINK